MSNDKLFNPLGVIVPGLTGAPRIPGETPGEAEFKQALSQPQQTGGGDTARPQSLVGGGVAGGGIVPGAGQAQPTVPTAGIVTQPPQTIAAGFPAYAARNADQINLEYHSSFASEG